MTLICDSPAWAWGAGALLLAAAGLALRSPRSWRWRGAVILLPLGAAAAIALALARPVFYLLDSTTAPVVILLDLSDSTRTAPWRDPEWLRALAARRLGPRRAVTVVGFDDLPRVLLQNIAPENAARWPLQWPAEAAPGTARRRGTNLAAALAWRDTASADASPQYPRWLITDGLAGPPPNRATIPFPLAVTLVPPTALDLAVHDIHARPAPPAPSDPDAHAQPAIEVLVEARAVGPLPAGVPTLQATVTILRDGILLARQPVMFFPRPNETTLDATRWLTVRDTLPSIPANSHHYTATIARDPAIADPWPENDSASILWRAPDQRRVLIISSRAPAALQPPLAALATRPGTRVITPEIFRASASELAADAWQIIILDDVPLITQPGTPALPAGEAAALDHAVRDNATGLVILGRQHAFAPGGYDRPNEDARPLETLSPLASRPPDPTTPRHILFLLDASASMNELTAPDANANTGAEKKFRGLAQAALQAAALLNPADRLTILTFNDTSQTLVDAPYGNAASTLPEKLAAVAPAGATVPDSLLPLIAAAAPAGIADEKLLIFFITDGEIPQLDVPRWKNALTHPNFHFTLIAPIAPQPSTPLAQLLTALAPNATAIDAPDPRLWTELLERALHNQITRGPQTTPLAWRSIDPRIAPPLAGTTHEWLDAWPKPEATALIATNSDSAPSHTLAALAQRGLGRVAAFALADPSPAFQSLFDQTLSRLTPPPGDRRFAITFQKSTDGTLQLLADAADENAFLNHQTLRARLFTADGIHELAFQQTSPGHYRAALPAVLQGAMNATIVNHTADNSESLVAQIPIPALESAEWPASIDAPLTPAQFPAATLLEASDASTQTWSPPLPDPVALAPPLSLIAVLLLLGALYCRR